MTNRSRVHRSHARLVLGGLIAGIVVGIFASMYLLAYYPQVPVSPAPAPREPVELPGAVRAVANVLAITGEDGGEGVLGTATVELRNGEGRLLVSANPFVEPDTQDSIKVARDAVENFLGVSLDKSDIIVSFAVGPDTNFTRIVGGPSAGSALAVAILAAVQGKSVNRSVAFTGTIREDGSIGPVAGILEKAEAAGKAGMKAFLVPPGQRNITSYERRTIQESRGRFTIQRIRYYPRTISLDEYTRQWNMSTFEVQNILDAAKIAIDGFEPPAKPAVAGTTSAATGLPHAGAPSSEEGCENYR